MVSLLPVLLLAVIQGLTEFLPISSSGHLAVGQKILNVKFATPLLLSVLLHGGTLIAVFVAFRENLLHLLRGAMRRDHLALKEISCILLTTLITGLIGISFKAVFAQTYEVLGLIGAFWWVTAILLIVSDRLPNRDSPLSYRIAAIVGLAQALAIFPGISRSGMTIVACLFLGLSKSQAITYAFMISIPAILGGIVLELRHLEELAMGKEQWLIMATGVVVSAVVGYFSIFLLKRLVVQQKLWWFSLYLILVGGMAMAHDWYF